MASIHPEDLQEQANEQNARAMRQREGVPADGDGRGRAPSSPGERAPTPAQQEQQEVTRPADPAAAGSAAPAQAEEPWADELVERGEGRQTVPRAVLIYLIAAVAAMGGLLFGYDTGVISGAELYLVRDFHMTPGSEELAVSAVLIGAVIGAAIGGKLGDGLGRRITLLVMAVIFGAGAILTAIAPGYWWFVVFRIIVGIGIGAASLMAPVYVAEIAPARIRGTLVLFFQLAITVGIAVAYWVDLAFAAAGWGWRPMFAAAIIPALVLGVGMLLLSDTPRWLGSRGRWDEAARVARQTATLEEAKEEIRGIRKALASEESASLRDFMRPGLRVALIVAVMLGIFQQFVGINTVIYYAPTIFQLAGYHTANAAILATAVVGVVNVLSTVVAVLLVDRLGRRPLLLIGLTGIVISLAAMGYIFLIGPKNAAVLVLIALLVYILSFAISMGPVFWLLSAELFPNRLRARGASIAVTIQWAANLLVSVTFLTLLNGFGTAPTFWLYAAIGVCTFVFVWFLVPETRGRPLERIETYWTSGRRWDVEDSAEMAGMAQE